MNPVYLSRRWNSVASGSKRSRGCKENVAATKRTQRVESSFWRSDPVHRSSACDLYRSASQCNRSELLSKASHLVGFLLDSEALTCGHDDLKRYGITSRQGRSRSADGQKRLWAYRFRPCPRHERNRKRKSDRRVRDQPASHPLDQFAGGHRHRPAPAPLIRGCRSSFDTLHVRTVQTRP